MVAECTRERAGEKHKVRERVSRTDRVKEKEGESSRRCDALPRVEVIDRGCNENGGVTRRVRGCRGGREERWSKERGGKGEERTESEKEEEGKRMQASTVGGVRVQLHRPTTAQLCIRTPLHPAAVVAAAAGTLAPAGEPMLLWQSIALSSPSLPSFSLASPDPSPPPFVISPGAHPFLSQAESRAPRGPDLAQPPNQRRRRHGGCCARRACERDPQN